MRFATDEASVEESAEARLECPACGRWYPRVNGIYDFLVDTTELSVTKRREIEGWGRVLPAVDDAAREFMLQLPVVSDPNAPETDHWRLAEEEFPVAMSLMGDLRGKRVLDLGGAICWASKHFAVAGAEVVAVDMTASALQIGRIYLNAQVHFERFCADAEALPFQAGSFDFVFCCASIHHFPESGRVLAEAFRVLKGGGRFISINEAFQPVQRSRERVLHHCGRTTHYLNMGINEQVFTHGEYRGFFERAGFDFETILLRWDVLNEGGKIRVGRDLRFCSEGYAISGAGGSRLRRLFQRLHGERLLRHNAALRRIVRWLLLHGTQSFRLLVGTKPVGKQRL